MQESAWAYALELRSDPSLSAGSSAALCDAVRRGATWVCYLPVEPAEKGTVM